MKSFKKKLQVLAVAAALGAGMAGNAQAGILGQSVLELTGILFSNPGGGGPLNIIPAGPPFFGPGQFTAFSFADTTNISADLNGVSDSIAVTTTVFAVLDPVQQCVADPGGIGGGVCPGFGQNNYSHRSAPSTVNVARGDTLLAGAAVINPFLPTPADAHAVAEAQLTSVGGTGSTQSTLALLTTFTFAPAFTQSVVISFASDSHLIADVGAGELGGAAFASESWTASISRADGVGGVLFSWTPDGVLGSGITGGTEAADTCSLNRTLANSTPGTTQLYDCIGLHAAETFVLTAGVSYTATLRHNDSADVIRVAVPEPGSLLLLGIGLAGLGFGVSRRKQVAA